METDSVRRAIALDFAIVTSNLFIFVMLAGVGSMGISGGWWFAALVALVSGGLMAAADRSRTGLGALVAVGVLAIVALLWVGATAGDLLFAYVPWLFLGLGVGLGLNRVVFGVIRPLPDLRRRRVSSR